MINRFLLLAGIAAVLGCSTTAGGDHLLDTDQPMQFNFSWDSGPNGPLSPADYANVLNLLESDRPMLALYREDVTHQAVVDFFVELTGSEEIAMPILYHANREHLSLSLVFALSWVESRYSPVAVNRNATSVDRGLFQLNSRTFRDLSEDDFFHPDVNARHGTEYLTWCMEHTNSDMEAVSCYNAGLTRVRAGRTPQSTLIYADRIKEFRSVIERRFRTYILREFPSHST
ncbi:MAG TPA: transglycosylase SLT domain-containing protein [Alkalispirochaeta sp.]|nr:transglycosylase SLT domain-containing protein [Alkalispirochaeta sp.]